MNLTDSLPRRGLLRLLALGLVLAALPVGGERGWDAPLALAGDDDDHSGPGGGGDDDRDDDEDDREDDEDRDEDDRGDDDDRDDSDDRDEDRDGDNSGPGGGDRDEDRRDGDRDDRDGGERDRDPGLRNITVLYPDGWTERIVDGRYELLDHQSRLVVRRAATAQDFGRMIALR